MLYAGRNPHNITWANFLNFAAPLLHPAFARRND
jgi:hypothetical protein